MSDMMVMGGCHSWHRAQLALFFFCILLENSIFIKYFCIAVGRHSGAVDKRADYCAQKLDSRPGAISDSLMALALLTHHFFLIF